MIVYQRTSIPVLIICLIDWLVRVIKHVNTLVDIGHGYNQGRVIQQVHCLSISFSSQFNSIITI